MASLEEMQMSKRKEVMFDYYFYSANCNFKNELHLKVTIPMEESINEFVNRIANAFYLPFRVIPDLTKALLVFKNTETNKFYDEISSSLIKKAQEADSEMEDVVRKWEKLFKTETISFADPEGTTDEELFSVIYHQLVHSPALENILEAEQAYAETASAAAEKRIKLIRQLSDKQSEDMDNAIKELHTRNTERDINDLAAKQLEDHSLTTGRLNSEIDALHKSQRNEYRTWLMSMVEQQILCPSQLSSPSPLVPERSLFASGGSPSAHWPEQEESFTIYLGSQMKQMHNIRILAADLLDFCSVAKPGSGIEPRRLEIALSLYSSGLSGLVLLTDCGPNDGITGLYQNFARVCQQTTEFHFDRVDDQLQKVLLYVKKATTWRNEKQAQQVKKLESKDLQPGDIYITRHSNLSQVHVVFHMVVDDSIKSNDLTSRHAAILGLRNILKTAANYDITTLTLPLLLAHEMTEEMTVAWCCRRAELVFKCVKGFMMEAAASGGSELHNLQFLLPPGIAPDVFSALSTMLPSIFRVSNPLILKPSTSSTPQTPKHFVKNY